MPNVSVSDATWRKLNRRKEPGETFEEVIKRLVDKESIAGIDLETENNQPVLHLAGTDLDIGLEPKVNGDSPIGVNSGDAGYTIDYGDEVYLHLGATASGNVDVEVDADE